MSIVIRKISLEDAYEYTALHIACWRDAYTGIIPDEYFDKMSADSEKRAEMWRQTLKEPDDCEYLCIMCENKMIGRLIFSKSRDEDMPHAGEVIAIYLLAGYWGKGYGKQAMDFAVAGLRQAGYNEIFLWVLEENSRARRFYEKYGFVYDGTRQDIEIGKTVTEIRYVLK